jgi:predicted lipoprotein with Yx(FWY)xxD motif
MRKSGWAAAAGLGSLVLLLTACGGSSSSSTGGSGSTPTATNAATQAAGQPSSAVGLPSPGTTILIAEKSKLGYVLATASGGYVVYTYSGDKKGGSPSCTSSCAAQWPAVTGKPQTSTAVHLPGVLGTVTAANGAKQVTYNGLPLYTLKGAKAFSVAGNGGMWHVVKLPKSAITATG